ncbi:MAG: hypothetical protein U0992_25315 [Planctomycetaceae bacterium]
MKRILAALVCFLAAGLAFDSGMRSMSAADTVWQASKPFIITVINVPMGVYWLLRKPNQNPGK